MNVLFVTWDGPGTRYHESLFVPIFERLQAAGVGVHLLQFSWESDDRSQAIARACQAAGIRFTAVSLPRWARGLAAAAALPLVAAVVVRLVRRHGIDVLMPRSILPVGGALLARRMLPHVRLFYDADGFMADERVEFGGWSRRGLAYQVLRRVERAGVLEANVVIVRTSCAKVILLERGGGGMDPKKIHVIPNGKDEQHFHPSTDAGRASVRRDLGVGERTPLIAYAGSLGPQYHTREMFSFLGEALRLHPSVRLLLLTHQAALAREIALRHGISEGALIVRSAEPADVARHLAAADLGLAFRTPSLSQQGVSPIKVAEYLLCGVPVLGSAGVGDLDIQIGPTAGALLRDLRSPSLQKAARWFMTEVMPARARYRAACRTRGAEVFGLGECVSRYRAALQAAASPT